VVRPSDGGELPALSEGDKADSTKPKRHHRPGRGLGSGVIGLESYVRGYAFYEEEGGFPLEPQGKLVIAGKLRSNDVGPKGVPISKPIMLSPKKLNNGFVDE
jgi:hypothetical protein